MENFADFCSALACFALTCLSIFRSLFYLLLTRHCVRFAQGSVHVVINALVGLCVSYILLSAAVERIGRNYLAQINWNYVTTKRKFLPRTAKSKNLSCKRLILKGLGSVFFTFLF